jgi:GTP-binding protein YchF
MKIGLLGFPQAGKKTFFTLLTGRKYPAGGLKAGEALEGIAPVHDPRVDKLAEIFKPEKTRYAENAIVLCPDVSPSGPGTVREWLESARHCDLLCLLVRAFSSAEVYHPLGRIDAERDRQNLEAEILLADLEIIEKRLERIAKEKKGTPAPAVLLEEKCLVKIKETIEKETHLAKISLSKPETDAVKSLGLLSLKPVLWAYNVDEDKMRPTGENTGVFLVSCRIEEEIMALENPEERTAYLKELGVSSSGLDRLNQAAYATLGLMSFYTVINNEVRAWTIRKGATAPEAAGKVHSDMERGFIRVEIIKYDDLVAAGGEAAAKAQGKMQLKGRDYIIEDGDVCHFRFNV